MAVTAVLHQVLKLWRPELDPFPPPAGVLNETLFLLPFLLKEKRLITPLLLYCRIALLCRLDLNCFNFYSN